MDDALDRLVGAQLGSAHLAASLDGPPPTVVGDRRLGQPEILLLDDGHARGRLLAY